MIAISLVFILFFFFFNDTATTEIYTLSLHDALPIYQPMVRAYLIPQALKGGKHGGAQYMECDQLPRKRRVSGDRKSTRLNSSHSQISYAVFCLKKKKIRPHAHHPLITLEHQHRIYVF